MQQRSCSKKLAKDVEDNLLDLGTTDPREVDHAHPSVRTFRLWAL